MKSFTFLLFVGTISGSLLAGFPAAQASTETVLYAFCSQTSCLDGAQPLASLIDVNGTLYGVTEYGGTANDGTLFSVNRTTGAETAVYSFCSQKKLR